ncbi:MAG: carboxypeptidase-like regulatory domain-containing protein, partial [Acidobacteriota bacterium]|nr:carboxypeptidase-like regulatory domain-containing protein [Acidobacteriota bacterium]
MSNCTKSLVLLFVSCAFLNAQDFRATITGQVTDASGALVPNVGIKATNAGTNEVSETKSNHNGYYALPYLNPGTYNIEATAEGFNTLKRESIMLRVADKLNLPLILTVGQMTQALTVVGEQETVETTNADRGLVFDPIKTQEYPLNGRQSYMLMALTPGVIFTQEQFGANGFSGTRGWDTNGSYSINGGRTGTNQFLLNGAPISVDGSWQLAPNVEAIQEFKVMTNTYDAQFGRTGGGTVNTTLKSGGSSWHGDVFDYWRNSVLDANTVQNNIKGAPRGKHNLHQFGGIVGGPIRKDKDFVFASFEGWREVVP